MNALDFSRMLVVLDWGRPQIELGRECLGV